MENINRDYAKIKIGSLCMEIEKEYCYNKPHELHIIVPHVVQKKTIIKDGCTKIEETTYESITIVDSPQHDPIDS